MRLAGIVLGVLVMLAGWWVIREENQGGGYYKGGGSLLGPFLLIAGFTALGAAVQFL